MSLINDALRKARREAADSRARRRGPAFSSTLAPQSRSSRLGLGFVLGGLITLGAAIAGGGLVWWALGHRGQAQSIPQPTAAALGGEDIPRASSEEQSPPAAPSSATAKGTIPADIHPAREPVPSPAPLPLLRPAGGVPPENDPQGSSAKASAGDAAGGVAAPDQEPAEAPPPPQLAESGEVPAERTFVLDADLGHVSLHLDYIVFRPGAPFAGINDQEVVEGSIIEGFMVKTIDRDRVTLSDAAGLVILRVR